MSVVFKIWMAISVWFPIWWSLSKILLSKSLFLVIYRLPWASKFIVHFITSYKNDHVTLQNMFFFSEKHSARLLVVSPRSHDPTKNDRDLKLVPTLYPWIYLETFRFFRKSDPDGYLSRKTAVSRGFLHIFSIALLMYMLTIHTKPNLTQG